MITQLKFTMAILVLLVTGCSDSGTMPSTLDDDGTTSEVSPMNPLDGTGAPTTIENDSTSNIAGLWDFSDLSGTNYVLINPDGTAVNFRFVDDLITPTCFEKSNIGITVQENDVYVFTYDNPNLFPQTYRLVRIGGSLSVTGTVTSTNAIGEIVTTFDSDRARLAPELAGVDPIDFTLCAP